MTERMKVTTFVAAGAMIGVIAAGLLALPSLLPPAMANEEPARTLLGTMDDFIERPFGTDLVKPVYAVEPWVSQQVESQAVVRKIGYGRTEFVDIYRTATGTYSTDAIDTPHIQYPGIHKDFRLQGRLAYVKYYSDGEWSEVHYTGADSFRILQTFDGGALKVTDDEVCVRVKNATFC